MLIAFTRHAEWWHLDIVEDDGELLFDFNAETLSELWGWVQRVLKDEFREEVNA